MNKYIDRERYLTECRDNAVRRRIRDRQLSREERIYRRRKTIHAVFVVLWAVILVAVLIFVTPDAGGKDDTEVTQRTEPIRIIPDVEQPKAVDVPATEYAVIPSGATEMAVKATAYCPCPKCCGKWSGGPTASGVMPEQGRTIATDPDVIPTGSTVVYNGHEYVAEDTGSLIKGNRIDIYYDSHQDALEWGVQEITIYVLEDF